MSGGEVRESKGRRTRGSEGQGVEEKLEKVRVGELGKMRANEWRRSVRK